MSASRAVLGPMLIAGQLRSWSGMALAGVVVAAQTSDVLDGLLARHWNCDTAAGSLFDSMADTVFYLCAALALWIGQPQTVMAHGRLLIVVLTLEAVRIGFDTAKYGRPASYHSYLAKFWGAATVIAVVATFALGRSNFMVPVALVVGIVSELEGLAMSVLLPVRGGEVKTIAAALRFRQQLLYGLTGKNSIWISDPAGVTSKSAVTSTWPGESPASSTPSASA